MGDSEKNTFAKFFTRKNLTKTYLIIVLLSLFGYAVLGSQSRRDNLLFDAIYRFATVPREIRDVITNLFETNYQMELVPNEFSNMDQFKDIVNNTSLDIEGVKIRTADFETEKSTNWRVIVGLFKIDGKQQHAILTLSPDNEIDHILIIKDEIINSENMYGGSQFIHGYTILNDNSIIFSRDDQPGTYRIDSCGELIWKSDTLLHHAIYPDEQENNLWGLQGIGFGKIDTRTGAEVITVSPEKLIAANQEISLFDIKRVDDDTLGQNNRYIPFGLYQDPLHFNDIEPLPAALADKFPMFEVGDLLMSARSLNLIAVIDPNTFKLKWYNIGNVKRQHDPDWGADGKITVFDNRMGEEYSRIISIDPSTQEIETLVDGAEYDFYSRVRGKHHVDAKGNIFITSSMQGRFFEVDNQGRVTLEILVTAPDFDNMNFVVSDAVIFTSEYTPFAGENVCSN